MPSPTIKKLRNLHGLQALAVALVAAAIIEACSKPSEPSAQAAPAGSTAPGTARVISIEAGEEGYKPATVKVKAGEAVVLRFTRTTKGECLKQVKIPDLKIQKDLPLNVAVEIPITLEKAGTVGFQCGMDMVKGIEVAGR